MHQQDFHPQVLAEALWPNASWLREVTLILGGSLLIALTAQISLTIGPVPLTGQTFGVLLVAALLGRRSALSVLAYITQGALGLPVFAGGTAGPTVLFGPTGGYLLGFVAAAFVVGWLCESGWDRRVATAVVALLIGNVIIYLLGTAWLANFVGWPQVAQVGLVPFIPGDVIKIILVALALPFGWRLLQQ